MKFTIAMAAACAAFMALPVAAPVSAIAPDPLHSPAGLPADMGAVRLSLRSQIQLTGPLYIWFLRDGGVPENEGDLLRFRRDPGMPMMGRNMIDSQPRIMAVRPGRYRLIAYSVTCDTLPPLNSLCFPKGMKMPTARYVDPPASIMVEKGRLTDAGEFVLEFPADWDVGGALSYQDALASQMMLNIRWRRIAAAMPAAFAALPAGPAPTAEASAMSSLQCDIRPDAARLYYPFKC